MHGTGGIAEREWWQTRWFAALAVVVACVPLLYPRPRSLTDAVYRIDPR